MNINEIIGISHNCGTYLAHHASGFIETDRITVAVINKNKFLSSLLLNLKNNSKRNVKHNIPLQ